MHKVWCRVLILICLLSLNISSFAQSTLDTVNKVGDTTTTNVENDNLIPLSLDDIVQPNIVDRTKVEYAWVFFVVVLVLILVGLIRAFGLSNHQLAIKVAFVNIAGKLDQLEKELSIGPIVILQAIVSSIILSLGLFLIQPLVVSMGVQSSLVAFLLVLLIVLLIYTFKYFAHYIVGLVLQAEDLAMLMVVNLIGLLYAFTLFVFPFIVIWFYAPYPKLRLILYVFLGISLVIFLGWRLVKSASIYYRYFPFDKIYIIIYLCTLEITPLLIIMKMIN